APAPARSAGRGGRRGTTRVPRRGGSKSRSGGWKAAPPLAFHLPAGEPDEERHAKHSHDDADRQFLRANDDPRADVGHGDENAAEDGRIRDDPAVVDADQKA